MLTIEILNKNNKSKGKGWRLIKFYLSKNDHTEVLHSLLSVTKKKADRRLGKPLISKTFAQFPGVWHVRVVKFLQFFFWFSEFTFTVCAVEKENESKRNYLGASVIGGWKGQQFQLKSRFAVAVCYNKLFPVKIE